MTRSVDIEEAVQQYLARIKNKDQAQGTYDAYEDSLMQAVAILHKMGVNKIRYIDGYHMDRVFNDSKIGWAKPDHNGKVISPGHRNNHRARLRAFFKWAQSASLVSADPMLDIDSVKFLPSAKVRFSYEALRTIIAAAKHPRDRVLLALAMYTGLRVGEILTLRVGDVDFDAEEIYAIHHKTKRRVPKPAYRELLREISVWLAYYESKVGPLADDMYLVPRVERPTFTGDKTVQASDDRRIEPYLRYTGAFAMLGTLLRGLGLDVKGQKWHMFRRTAGRLMYDRLCADERSKDKALRMVQAFYGHATRAVTENYLGLNAEHEEMSASVKGQNFFPDPPEADALPDNVIQMRGTA